MTNISPENMSPRHMDVVWCVAGLERLKKNGVIGGELPYEIADPTAIAAVVAAEYTPTKENIIVMLRAIGGGLEEELEQVADLLLSGAGEEIKDWTPVP